MTPAERFWAKVEPQPDGCWMWTGATWDGYGIFKDTHFAPDNCKAHRWAYSHFVGPIPEGMQLDHLCRNRACVNPAHLEPVTHRENVLRGESPSAQRARQTHCKHGHEFTPENTYVEPSGRRRCCRTCRAEVAARSNARRAAARRALVDTGGDTKEPA